MEPHDRRSRSSGRSGSLRRQCLFAVTILLVEDSRSASEAIRLFAAESGARVRRADSLHAASRHLAIYRPNVVMVDLGLPDGDGMGLIRHLASASTPLGAIVALSAATSAPPGRPRRSRPARPPAWRSRSPSLRAFQECVLSVLPDAETRPRAGRARAGARRARLGAGGARRGHAPRPRAARRGAARRRHGDRGLLRAVPRLGRRDARRRRASSRAARGAAPSRGGAGASWRGAARRSALRRRGRSMAPTGVA